MDFYNDFDELDVTPEDERAWESFLDELEDSQREALETPWVFYSITLRNEGELVMPVPLKIVYEDGEEELLTLPAEIWAKDHEEVEAFYQSPNTHHQLDLRYAGENIPHTTARALFALRSGAFWPLRGISRGVFSRR